jgi:hypothetical protein
MAAIWVYSMRITESGKEENLGRGFRQRCRRRLVDCRGLGPTKVNIGKPHGMAGQHRLNFGQNHRYGMFGADHGMDEWLQIRCKPGIQ